MVGRRGPADLGRCGEALALSEMGEVELVGWIWWRESRGIGVRTVIL